ncbi:MAG: winged helix-turn-helix transcriptional regulator [Bosea sp. (in: a-proteobacteria)]
MSMASETINLDERGARAADIAGSEDERRHIAGLLASVEREAHVSQRKLASELGVALGLVNTYIKRCVKKGLIKVQEVPSRRYAYYLTPHGFAEKSRLTAEYLSWSLTFFRRARMDCAAVIETAEARGWKSVGLVGGSDLAEIAILAAAEQDMAVAGLIDAGMSRANVMGVAVFASTDAMQPRPDGWIVTSIENAQGMHDALVASHGVRAVLAPALLNVRGERA